MLEARLTTGQLAALVDRSPATIRRYEAIGIIPPANRDPISRRRFWTRAQADSIRRRLLPVAVDRPHPSGSARPGQDPNGQPTGAMRADCHATD